ncbi:putative disease resistance protein [Quercus suber]|uniref:Disease resistance protein n=1 Tax=Quercus suber TaxID=58331 RepID=A0AAW0KNB0_QUESU
MAKVVANRAKFDEVAFAVVSKNKVESKIQDQISGMLGLELDELDLEAVRIPYGGQHNKCKILLTLQSKEACTRMRSQKNFPIRDLTEEEAWSLFREMAGNFLDTPGLHPIAKEVAKECGGLPVAIVTVGKALANKSKVEWIAALQWQKRLAQKIFLIWN